MILGVRGLRLQVPIETGPFLDLIDHDDRFAVSPEREGAMHRLTAGDNQCFLQLGAVQARTFKDNLPLYTMAGDYHVFGFSAVPAGTTGATGAGVAGPGGTWPQ